MRQRMTSPPWSSARWLALVGIFLGSRKLLEGSRTINGAVSTRRPTKPDTDDAAPSRRPRAADIIVPAEAVEGLWNPEHLERLARTYWISLTRFTFGLVRVVYTEDERYVVLLHPALRLLTIRRSPSTRWTPTGASFAGASRRACSWRCRPRRRRLPRVAGLPLRLPRLGQGPHPRRGRGRELLPEIASTLGRWVYANTQSRIHVVACHASCASSCERELDVSPVGRYAGPASVAEHRIPAPPATAAPPAGSNRPCGPSSVRPIALGAVTLQLVAVVAWRGCGGSCPSASG